MPSLQMPGFLVSTITSRNAPRFLVHGRIHYTKWVDATGVDSYGCEIIAEKVDFFSRPKSAESENPEPVDRDDEIPF